MRRMNWKPFLLVIFFLAIGHPGLIEPASAQSREVRVVSVTGAVAGQSVAVPVEIVAQGNEAAIGFTVTFNPAVLASPTVAVGNGAPDATLFVNSNEAFIGLLGVTLAMPIGQTLQAGVRRLVTITFGVAPAAPVGATPVGFGDQLAKREVSDANANSLPATFTAGQVNIVQPNPNPALTAINPAIVSAGSNALTLTLTGTGFRNSSVVRLASSPRPTTFVSETQLTAQIPTSDLVLAGSPPISVQTPAPGGGISNELPLTINNPVPSLASISPNSIVVGTNGATLTVNGSNFVTTSKVRYGDQELPTTYVNATQLTAQLSATQLSRVVSVSVTVFNPTPAGGTSGALPLAVVNPQPAITSLDPANRVIGGPAFTLTVNGTGFTSDSVVSWNGDGLVTTFVSSTRLSANVTENLTGAPSTVAIRVVTPPPGGGPSNTLNFVVGYPIPTISSLTPPSAIATSKGVRVVIAGTGYYINQSEVRLNGKIVPSGWDTPTQLTATIPAAEIPTAGVAQIVVANPTPGGGPSTPASFTIVPIPTAQLSFTPPNPAPEQGVTANLSGTWPNVCVPRFPDFEVSAGEIRITTVNTTDPCPATPTPWSLSASRSFPGGIYRVRVTYKDAFDNLFTIAETNLAVGNVTPALSSLNPSSAPAGGPAFTLTVNGSNFVNTAIVRWNDADRPTTYVSDTQLRAAITAADIASPGAASVKVVNPGGGTSAVLSFTVQSSLASVSAASFAGEQLAPDSIAAAFGTGLATRVEIGNTTPLPTELAGTRLSIRDSAGTQKLAPLFFVAPAQINFQMPADLAAGAALITVSSGDGKMSAGNAQIAAVAPGLFSANANGQGVAAATVLRVKANGEQIFEPISRFDSGQNRFVAVPVDLGPESDQVFLVLSGTGFRGRSALSAVNCKIGGTDVEVLYAGLTPGLVGLDQANVRLPRSLAGRGEIDVVLTVDGRTANAVRVSVR